MSSGGSQPGDLLRLGTLETQVMDTLWDHGPATVREVIDRLPSERAYTTIATVLANLDRKHLVTITRQNHSTRYGARMSRCEHTAQLMEQVLDTSGDREASILQFVDSMPESDLDLLRDYLDRRDQQRLS